MDPGGKSQIRRFLSSVFMTRIKKLFDPGKARRRESPAPWIVKNATVETSEREAESIV
jgi:hypothetical protein